LDSNGDVLFRLVRNFLIFNPGNCSKFVGNTIGYEIHDSNDVPIFKVETRYIPSADRSGSRLTTTLAASFYNQQKELVFSANSGEDNERIDASCRCAFGLGSSGLVAHFGPWTDQEKLVAKVAVETGGLIHELVTGEVTDANFVLDGKILYGATITGRTIHVHTGNFLNIGSTITHCGIAFYGQADNIRQLVLAIERTNSGADPSRSDAPHEPSS
jgi:hypothetical protein